MSEVPIDKQIAEVNDLLGLCREIVSDGVVTEKEAIYLASWIARNPDICALWPANVLLKRLTRILEDKILTPEELADLSGMLKEVVNVVGPAKDQKGHESELFEEPAALPVDHPQPEITFERKRFCFVGRFLSGNRSWYEQQTKDRGGTIVDRVSEADYLVIGTLPRADLREPSETRKIEEAAACRQSTECPSIVSEKHWSTFLK